jgi:hypothetical protein
VSKIYAVNSGRYSDRGIDALFDNREMAELFMKLNPSDGYDGYKDIREYELNPGSAEMREGYSHYWVQMKDDGSLLNPPEIRLYGMGEGLETEFRPYRGGRFLNWKGWARSTEHAVKIANEHRIMLLASTSTSTGVTDDK